MPLCLFSSLVLCWGMVGHWAVHYKAIAGLTLSSLPFSMPYHTTITLIMTFSLFRTTLRPPDDADNELVEANSNRCVTLKRLFLQAVGGRLFADQFIASPDLISYSIVPPTPIPISIIYTLTTPSNPPILPSIPPIFPYIPYIHISAGLMYSHVIPPASLGGAKAVKGSLQCDNPLDAVYNCVEKVCAGV